MPKIVFMGTPDFAVPALQALIRANFTIPLVVSQPDRKKGRGHKVQFPPVKQVALEHEIEVYQPDSVKDEASLKKLASIEADFFVVIAYGRILPESILNLPKIACINVHASLLPQWRGAAPIQFSLLNGDSKTGVCTMMMDKGMDTGDLLLVEETTIEPDETYGELSERLSQMGGTLIVKTINQFDGLTPVSQDNEKATYTRLLKKEDRFINWDSDSRQIYCQFRAMMPQPGVVTTFRGKRLLIKSMQPIDQRAATSSKQPGEIVQIDTDGIVVICGSGLIRILSCQPESKNEVNAQAFANGYQVKTGEFMGDKN